MADQPKRSIIAQQFSGLPMKALIGAPLKAATDANAMIAHAQVQFLLSSCFEPSSKDRHTLKPIMVTFQLERKILDSQGNDQPAAIMEFSVPLMMIIPINSLAIETLKISFEMEVKSSQEFTKEDSKTQESRKNDKSLHRAYKPHEFDTELHGSLTSKSDGKGQKSTGANYEVILTAGQLPLPKGVTAILDIFSKNLNPIPSKNNPS